MLPPARSVAALDQVIKDVSTSDNLLSPFAATTATGMSAVREKASGHALFSSVGSLQYVTNEGKCWTQCALMPNCVTRIAKTVPHV